jgi:tungstate transport system ATP-binding protein
MTPSILEFQDIRVHAGPRVLLDIPSFQLNAEECVSLIGPNGSGKTTFLHIAASLRAVSAGEVVFDGQTLHRANVARFRRRVSVVFQDPLLFSVDVLQNASAGLHFQGVPRAEARRRAREFLTLFGVAHLENSKPYGLSGGEAARVALARAFATYPELLLMDEPFSALDAGTRALLLPELLERLKERGAAAILVTHDIAEAYTFAPRVAVLDRGKLIADGNVRDLTLRPPSRRAAELLGAGNLMSGSFIASEGDFGKVEIAPGMCLLAAHRQELPSGTRVDVTIPATQIRLLPRTGTVPDRWNAIPARVESVTAQPNWDQITLVAPGMMLEVRANWTPGESGWATGDVLTAAIPPDAAWIIPTAASG